MGKIIFFVVVVIFIAFLAEKYPYAIASTDEKMSLVYSATLLSIMALSARSLPLNQTAKYAAAWILVFLVMVLAYSYKDNFLNSRIAAELMPNRPQINKDGSISLRASQDGHFYVEARVNGVAINFMIDTGASDVVLNREDARRIGINTDELAYTRTYRTANGETGGALVKLRRLQIGSFILEDFPASVNEGELDNSLLGMSALKELGSFKVDGDQMIIGYGETLHFGE